MVWLLLGLFGFLGVHSIRIVAPAWRERMLARLGEKPWKGLYTLLSLGFFALMVWGFGQAKLQSSLVWAPPTGLRHVAYLIVLVAFVLLAAAYVPRNAFKRRLGHPMLVGTTLWAFAHLLMSGLAHAMLLFAGFLVWSLLALASARNRPAPPPPNSRLPMTLLTVVIGIALYMIFVLWLHLWLVGIAPIALPG